jgi:CBS domain containing-hemolysin-like protein
MSDTSKPSLLSKLKRRLGPKNTNLEHTLETHAEENGATALDSDARSMMRNVIGFADMRVKDLMVPRANIIAVDEESTMRELLELFISENHSRVPVYKESLDDVSGMIHVRDFLRWITLKGMKKKGKTAASALSLPSKELDSSVKQHTSLRHEVLYVPPSMPAPDLLLKMKASHIHLAMVVDEYGGTDGIVSLEDLVEVIIGDISDEHDEDKTSDMLVKVDDQTYVANAQLEISRLDEQLKVDLLPEDKDDDADTLAGLVFEMAGRVPARGEIIRHPAGLEFEIMDADARRIKKVRIHVKRVTAEPAEAASG